jgi:hypothetical protein
MHQKLTGIIAAVGMSTVLAIGSNSHRSGHRQRGTGRSECQPERGCTNKRCMSHVSTATESWLWHTVSPARTAS